MLLCELIRWSFGLVTSGACPADHLISAVDAGQVSLRLTAASDCMALGALVVEQLTRQVPHVRFSSVSCPFERVVA